MANTHFLFVTADPFLSNTATVSDRNVKGSAYDLAASRLSKSVWPLYARTRYKDEIASGAKIAFYVGGNKKWGRHIIASATVDAVMSWSYFDGVIDENEFLTEPPCRLVRLRTVRVLETPIPFKKRLPNLSIKPVDERYWGVVMQGGSVRLTAKDWAIIFK